MEVERMDRRLWSVLVAPLVICLAWHAGVGVALALQGNAGGEDAMTAPAEAEQLVPQSIIVQPAPSDLRVTIETDRSRYRVGDTVEIRFWVSEPAFVYIYNQDTRGNVRLIFPNRFDQDNWVRAGEHRLPGSGYRFRVEGPPGTEYLQILATRTRLRNLDWRNIREAFPLLGNDPLKVKEEVRSFLDVIPERSWSSAWTRFTVERRGPWPPWQRTGTLRVNSEPPWASVYLDGRYVGLTPLLEEVDAGGHWVEIRLDGYRTYRRWVYVGAGELTPVFAELEPR